MKSLERIENLWERLMGYRVVMSIRRSVCSKEREIEKREKEILKKANLPLLRKAFANSLKTCPDDNNHLRFDYFFRVECNSKRPTCCGGWAYIGQTMENYLASKPHIYFIPQIIIPEFVDLREVRQTCFVNKNLFENQEANKSLDTLLADIPQGDFEIDVPVTRGHANSEMNFYPDVLGKCCEKAKVLMRISVNDYKL